MTEKKYVTNDKDMYPVTIVRTDLRGHYPVLIITHKEGFDSVCALTADFRPYSGTNPLIRELSPYDDFVDGEPVMVRDFDHMKWEPYHFAGVNEFGYPLVYTDGGTKWSSNGRVVIYKECRKPTQEELERL